MLLIHIKCTLPGACLHKITCEELWVFQGSPDILRACYMNIEYALIARHDAKMSFDNPLWLARWLCKDSFARVVPSKHLSVDSPQNSALVKHTLQESMFKSAQHVQVQDACLSSLKACRMTAQTPFKHKDSCVPCAGWHAEGRQRSEQGYEGHPRAPAQSACQRLPSPCGCGELVCSWPSLRVLVGMPCLS